MAANVEGNPFHVEVSFLKQSSLGLGSLCLLLTPSIPGRLLAQSREGKVYPIYGGVNPTRLEQRVAAAAKTGRTTKDHDKGLPASFSICRKVARCACWPSPCFHPSGAGTHAARALTFNSCLPYLPPYYYYNIIIHILLHIMLRHITITYYIPYCITITYYYIIFAGTGTATSSRTARARCGRDSAASPSPRI